MVLTGGVWTEARAQDADDLKRGVARISLMDGQVSVKRGDSGDWVAGVINAPLMADDQISTGPNSRAEVQFDAANILRIGGTAVVHLTSLEYGRYQMEIAHGTVTYRVLRPSTGNVEVDTPSISVRPSQVGTYRIAVNDSGETELIVRAGDVEVFTPRGSQWVNAGQMMVARGTTADPEFQIVGARPYDDWDRWSDSRDRILTSSTSSQYVPQGVYGTEDLDNNGTWVNTPDYGYCWQPTVPPGWAPYSLGRWVWEDWYGWTWVSYDPWGWAPYHYGRWFWGSGGWMWYPGVIGVRHYWSPALVGFFGFGGGGFGVGFGFGNIGWVALAPYEIFHPWWGAAFYGRTGYLNRSMNFASVNINNAYRNARVGNGVVGVSANDFRSGRFGSMIRPSAADVRSAGLVRGQVPLAPTSASVRFADRQASYVPRASQNTRFFQHQQPAAVGRVPFAQQRGAEQGSRPTGAMAPGGGMRAGGAAGTQPTARSAAPADRPNTSTGGATGGWRRFGDPGARSTASTAGRPGSSASPSQAGGSSSWQRFGAPSGGGTRYGGGSGASSSQGYSQPRYNAPPANGGGSAPRYSAPNGSAPRSSGGGGGRAPSGGGGGGRSSGGGGGHASGGGHGHR
jgi:hypothetical protein